MHLWLSAAVSIHNTANYRSGNATCYSGIAITAKTQCPPLLSKFHCASLSQVSSLFHLVGQWLSLGDELESSSIDAVALASGPGTCSESSKTIMDTKPQVDATEQRVLLNRPCQTAAITDGTLWHVPVSLLLHVITTWYVK